MSEWKVEVVRIDNIEKHPNADNLSISNIHGGYPVIFKTGDYNLNDLAIYIPVDSICPDTLEYSFLSNKRIKAKRLRSIFSMGLLVPIKQGMKLGDIVDKQLGITKYEPHIESVGKGSVLSGDSAKDPGFILVYTDIESLRKHNGVLGEGEEVVIVEKLHGVNFRALMKDGKLWVGSHRTIKRNPWDYDSLGFVDGLKNKAANFLYGHKESLKGSPRWVYDFVQANRTHIAKNNVWSETALQYNLKETMKRRPNIVAYGECFGQVQDLKYGSKQGEVFLRLFDAYDIVEKRYLNMMNSFNLQKTLK